MLPAPDASSTYTRSPSWVTLLGESPVGSRSTRVRPSPETLKPDTLSLRALVTNRNLPSGLSCTEWDAPRPSPANRTDGPEPCPPVGNQLTKLRVPSAARAYIATSLPGP